MALTSGERGITHPFKIIMKNYEACPPKCHYVHEHIHTFCSYFRALRALPRMPSIEFLSSHPDSGPFFPKARIPNL